MPAKTRTTKTPPEGKVDLNPENPAEAAAAEVLGEGKIAFEFRGQAFEIDRSILASARLLVAVASGQAYRIIFEILGPANVDRFLQTVQRGEDIYSVSAEFMPIINKAAGTGNS